MGAKTAGPGQPDPFASPEAYAAALVGVLALDRPLLPPMEGEDFSAYMDRALTLAAVDYVFRLSQPYAQSPERVTPDLPLAPWPYYTMLPETGYAYVLRFWWWLDPILHFYGALAVGRKRQARGHPVGSAAYARTHTRRTDRRLAPRV